MLDLGEEGVPACRCMQAYRYWSNPKICEKNKNMYKAEVIIRVDVFEVDSRDNVTLLLRWLNVAEVLRCQYKRGMEASEIVTFI